MKKIIFPLAVLTVVLSSCDKIDNPIPEGNVDISGIQWDDSTFTQTSPSTRNVLIEEFTGQLCTFCPDGAREIERLDSLYGSQLIPISIHSGAFANPGNGAPNDFRTDAGTAYNSTFGVTGYPAGTVSRLNNAAITLNSQWQTDYLSISSGTPKVKIGMSVQYDDSTRAVRTLVTTEWLSTEPGTYNLQLYMVEDSIVAYQLDNGNPIQNYVHRHMLRKALNSTWGTPIPSSNLGDIDTQEFAFELDNEWVAKHCQIVAHVYAVAPDYEVLQAIDAYVIDH